MQTTLDETASHENARVKINSHKIALKHKSNISRQQIILIHTTLDQVRKRRLIGFWLEFPFCDHQLDI